MFFPLSLLRVLPDLLYIWVTHRVSYKKQEWLTLCGHISWSPEILMVSVLLFFLVFCVVLLFVFTLRVQKVHQWLATGRKFSPGTTISSTNKTERYDITEIVLKVALDTINQILTVCSYIIKYLLTIRKSGVHTCLPVAVKKAIPP